MTFPTPYPVPWFAYQGNASDTSELGNVLPSWADSVLKSVQGWDLLSAEELAEHVTEEKFEAFLLCPPDFWPAIQDRVGLPLPSNGMTAPTTMFNPDGSLAEGIFDVVGHDIEDSNFMAWRPGNVIQLKRAEG